MKKYILNLRNVQILSNEQQKSIIGGSCGCPEDGHGVTKKINPLWDAKP